MKVRYFALSLCLLSGASCSDLTAPHGSQRDAGRPPNRNMPLIIDWYNCASYDAGQTWGCEYDHSTSVGGQSDYWDTDNVFHTTSDCSMSARYCDNNFQPGGGGNPYSDPRETGRADEPDNTVLDKPTCPASNTASKFVKAYCAGQVPDSTQLNRIRAALDRMQQIGGICATLASIGYSVLASTDALHVFPQGSYAFGGGAPQGGGAMGTNSWMVISQDFTDRLYDSTHTGWQKDNNSGLWYKADLQSALAHELDHLGGYGHIMVNGVENPVLTPDEKTCSDIDMGNGVLRAGH